MKNLPEDELFNDLEARLKNYSEMPDDGTWEKIAGALPQTGSVKGWVWAERVSGVLVILMIMILLWPSDNIILSGKVQSSAVVNKPDASINNFGMNDKQMTDKKDHALSRSIAKELTTGSDLHESFNDDESNSIQHIHKSSKISLLKITGAQNKSNNGTGDVGLGKDRITVADNSSQLNLNSSGNAETSTSLTYDLHENDLNLQSTPARNGSLDSSQENLKANQANIINGVDSSQKNLKTNQAKNIDGVDSSFTNPIVVKLDTLKRTKKPESKPKTKKGFHPNVYVTLSPLLTYQKIKPVQNDEINVESLKSSGIFSANRLGLSLETGFQYAVLKKLEVYAGLSYYQQNEKITYQYVTLGPVDVKSSSNDLVFTLTPTSVKHEKTVNYRMRNVGVSVGAFYLIKESRLQHKIGIGLVYQQGLLKQGAGETYNNSKSSYLNYQLAYRMEYGMNSRTRIFIQPNIIHAIQSSESFEEPFTIKPYRVGIAFGLLYHF